MAWFQIGRAAARSLARWVTRALTPLGRVCQFSLLGLIGWGRHAVAGALGCKECLGIDEADGVVERIAGIEASFAPGSDRDRRQFVALGMLCSCVYGVEVIDAEVERLRIRANAFGIAICARRSRPGWCLHSRSSGGP
jgi:hypothetical protein